MALHISEYKNIITDLRREIDELKDRLNDKPLDYDMPENKEKLPRIESRHGRPANSGGNGNGSVGNIACTCGRMEEKEDIKSIKEQIFENFNERIQLRRAMMEIEEQNAMNILEIRKRQGDIMMLKKLEGWEENDVTVEQVKELSKLIATLKLSTNKNLSLIHI